MFGWEYVRLSKNDNAIIGIAEHTRRPADTNIDVPVGYSPAVFAEMWTRSCL